MFVALSSKTIEDTSVPEPINSKYEIVPLRMTSRSFLRFTLKVWNLCKFRMILSSSKNKDHSQDQQDSNYQTTILKQEEAKGLKKCIKSRNSKRQKLRKSKEWKWIISLKRWRSKSLRRKPTWILVLSVEEADK